MAYLRVCPESLQEIADFSPEFGEGDGLKTRRLGARNRSIGQVLISRTLSVCDEVAEKLKVAVCQTDCRLSAILDLPSKSCRLNHFADQATWLPLAQNGQFWHAAGTISGAARPSCACPDMSNIDNIRYGVYSPYEVTFR